MRWLGEMEKQVKGNDSMGEMGGEGKAELIWEEPEERAAPETQGCGWPEPGEGGMQGCHLNLRR